MTAAVLAAVFGFLAVSPQAGLAQQLGTPVAPVPEVPHSAILTLESDRLFSESAFGKRVASEIEAESAVLSAENRKMEAELTAEEKQLTERRRAMEPAAFRALADAFDQKVQNIRRTQDSKARALSQKADKARGDFLRAARPVFEALMQEAGASVILERSNVFLSANASDITDEAISRIDAAIGDGAAAANTGQDQ
ncbi:OmpH/Skp family outer membrane protein [Pseudodonghicola xiamenensis]|uniref:Molecular chaperone Skp n=1 Tax=Pseudodonghicola xiamenensis TaxID=337702 RepID=A0A8J3MBT2_9RHOB|nr:OmpH family outer membrane protein [Pseudodonghicola xiamenensis]GHG80663.1 molecular chaperone Skp [Pseudodonghicola xiamenensis]